MNLILGGTHGLGWDLAQQLREQGYEAFVIGRSYEAAIHGEGMRADMAKYDEMERVAGFIDALSDTALSGFYWTIGIGYNGRFADQPNVAEMMNVNLAHPVVVAQAAWRKLVAQEVRTDMVVVSSTTGIRIRKDETTYATTKGGQVSFARNLRSEAETLKSKARVTLFEPGGMQSPFWDKHSTKPANYENFMKTADVAAFILNHLQLSQAEAEKMIEKSELDAWLAERQ